MGPYEDIESREIPISGSPSLRRNLYEGPSSSTHQEFDLNSELLSVREDTINLSSRALLEGFTSSDEEAEPDAVESPAPEPTIAEERTPLLDPLEAETINPNLRVEKAPPHVSPLRQIMDDLTFANVIGYIPSVLVGVLLNVLDGLSYGMILFPTGLAPFHGLEAAGLSIFYVSTIVCQLVFSLGASHLQSCVGSEMIEIVPFFHSIATTIANGLEGAPKDEILATTITAFSLSALVTGLIFFLLGFLKLGTVVGFFPRHILVGCIGGVGYFLVSTAMEVSSRIAGNIEYNLETLKFLFSADVAPRWISCLIMAGVLLYLERRFSHPLIVPAVLGIIFVGVYAVLFAIPNFSLEAARRQGWIFPAQEVKEPFYHYYTMYKFGKVHWTRILETIPAMFALTFFGLIHVPINIPALAAATKDDNVNTNQELVAHGISNTLSGLVGSIQNYLVYTNSVMFIKSGGVTRLSGILLAIATTLVMIAGPESIGYIPVMVVASLMFMMGLDLMAEALVDPYGKVDRLEYFTIVAIVLTMGGYDFVVGIVVGIILACFSYVVSTSRDSAIRATFTGNTARSTVNRSPSLQRFLARVGSQIYIIKLQGPLFFGTCVQVEQECRNVIENQNNKIKYLILDLHWVTNIDYCCAETFSKIKRLADRHRMQMVLSGAQHEGSTVRGLRAVDLVHEDYSPTSVRLFPSLNSTLEYCENAFLAEYYSHRDRVSSNKSAPRNAHRARYGSSSGSSAFGMTPRANVLRIAAENVADEDMESTAKYNKFKQPLPLLMGICEGISDKTEDFWFKATKYFKLEQYAPGSEVFVTNERTRSPKFCLLESGSLRTEYFQYARLTETILAGTAFGCPVKCSAWTKFRIIADSDVKVWVLDNDNYKLLVKENDEYASEIMAIAFNAQNTCHGNLISYLHVCSV